MAATAPGYGTGAPEMRHSDASADRCRGRRTAARAGQPGGLDFSQFAFHPLLTQLELLDLAGSGQRKRVDHEPAAWRLVGREMLAHVDEQLFLVDLLTRRGADERCDL